MVCCWVSHHCDREGKRRRTFWDGPQIHHSHSSGNSTDHDDEDDDEEEDEDDDDGNGNNGRKDTG